MVDRIMDDRRCLEGLVQSLSATLHQEFGQTARLSLEVYRDPEFDDQYLALFIRQPIYERTLMQRVERIREQYADQLANASGCLHITTDFRGRL